MDKFLSVLTLIGLVVMVFSFWSFLSIRKHIRESNTGSRRSSLTDERYFELKSKQDFIIAVSTIIFAVITFLGYSSIDSIRTELSNEFQSQRDSIEKLNSIANNNLMDLDKMSTKYKDSVLTALEMVTVLRKNINSISSKDIIKQNIFIVDPLSTTAFSKDILGPFKGFRFIKFSKLTTILGKRLPVFNIPPSIICFSNIPGNFIIGKINKEGFYIKTSDNSEVDQNFNVWISQKPGGIRYPPMANAGEDQIIKLPTSQVQLNGTGVSGGVQEYQWKSIPQKRLDTSNFRFGNQK